MIRMGPNGATATPSALAALKSTMVLPFWCRLTQIELEKRPLNGCLREEWNGLQGGLAHASVVDCLTIHSFVTICVNIQ